MHRDSSYCQSLHTAERSARSWRSVYKLFAIHKCTIIYAEVHFTDHEIQRYVLVILTLFLHFRQVMHIEMKRVHRH